MIKLKEAIIVEGKYDKIKLGQIFDAVIISTDGFGIFSQKDKQAYIRRIAEEKGIIVFTDPDGAGLVIRNLLKNISSGGKVYHAYIPEISGKEKRKTVPGKEGLLGVEGVDDELIIKAVMSCGIEELKDGPEWPKLTKGDMYLMGLSGGPDSANKRKRLARLMGLPSNISSNGLLDAINILYTKEELEKLLKSI